MIEQLGQSEVKSETHSFVFFSCSFGPKGTIPVELVNKYSSKIKCLSSY